MLNKTKYAFHARTSEEEDLGHRYLSDLLQSIIQAYTCRLDSEDQ
jgi:hypothetical protein